MESDVSSTTAHMAPPPLPEPIPSKPFDDREFLTANLACDYVEGEVGRYDWERNWAEHKKNGDFKDHRASRNFLSDSRSPRGVT